MRHFVEGHAIVSNDGAIADADGRMPPDLRNEADWRHFQARLDESDLTVLGRLGHAENPNARARRRLVLTSGAGGLEQVDALTHLLNPISVPIADALDQLFPKGAHVAVVGGTLVFDAFLAFGFDEFHLAVARQVSLPDGRKIFSDVLTAKEAGERLVASGLHEDRREILDESQKVVLTIYRRAV